MRVIIEISDEDVERLQKEFKLDVERLIRQLVAEMVNKLVELGVAQKTGISLDVAKINEDMRALGQRVFQESQKGDKHE